MNLVLLLYMDLCYGACLKHAYGCHYFNKIKNYILIKKYPFLKPKNVWNEKVPKDYDYSYTELDMMPRGWKKSFGLKPKPMVRILCESTL